MCSCDVQDTRTGRDTLYNVSCTGAESRQVGPYCASPGIRRMRRPPGGVYELGRQCRTGDVMAMATETPQLEDASAVPVPGDGR